MDSSSIWTTVAISAFGIICSGFVGFASTRWSKRLDNNREDRRDDSRFDRDERRLERDRSAKRETDIVAGFTGLVTALERRIQQSEQDRSSLWVRLEESEKANRECKAENVVMAARIRRLENRAPWTDSDHDSGS